MATDTGGDPSITSPPSSAATTWDEATSTTNAATSTTEDRAEVAGFGTPLPVSLRQDDVTLGLNGATEMAVAPNGSVAVGDDAGFVFVVRPDDKAWGSSTERGGPEITGVEFIDDQTLLAATADGELRWWSIDDAGRLSEASPTPFSPFGGEISSLAVSADGRWAAVGSIVGHVSLLDLSGGPGAPSRAVKVPRLSGEVTALAVGADNGRPGAAPRAVIGTDDGTLVVFDESATPSARPVETQACGPVVTSIVFTPDGQSVLCGGSRRPTEIDLAEGSATEIAVGTESGVPIGALAIRHRNGFPDLIASAGADRTPESATSLPAEEVRGVVFLWYADQPADMLDPGRGPTAPIDDLVFLPDDSGAVALVRGAGVVVLPLIPK